jgi:hypothetical protein
MDTIKPLLDSCRDIVSHFRHSVKMCERLRDLDVRLNERKKGRTLKQDVPTRWNSVYYMLKRLSVLKVPVNTVLEEFQKQSLHDNEWHRIAELTRLLEPFEEATVLLSGENYVTISMVQSVVSALLQFCAAFNSDSLTIKMTCKDIALDLSKRYCNPLLVELLATIIDPRWKSFSAWRKEQNEAAWKNLELLYKEHKNANEPAENSRKRSVGRVTA